MNPADPPEHKHEYLIAPPGWTPDDDNPFSLDGVYGPGFGCMVLRDDDEREWYGAGDKGLFALHVWAGLPDIQETVADFVRYENAHGRIPIIGLPERLCDRFLLRLSRPVILCGREGRQRGHLGHSQQRPMPCSSM